VRRPAILELRQLAESSPAAAYVAAGGSDAVCSVLQQIASQLRAAPTAHAVEVLSDEARHAFGALTAIAAGDVTSPPAWSVHSAMMPHIVDAMDTLASAALNRFGRPPSRSAALREGSMLFDRLFHQLRLDTTDGAALQQELGYSLAIPPPSSRLRWVEGAEMGTRLPTLIERGVRLLPRQATPSSGSRGSAAGTTSLLSPRRHALPPRALRPLSRAQCGRGAPFTSPRMEEKATREPTPWMVKQG